MKKIAIILFTFLVSWLKLFSQEYFEFNNPSFSFSIPEGWKEYKGAPSTLMFGKYVKVNNGIIGGILRVGRDIYSGNLETIWNLNEETEKKGLEKEALIRNYTFKKDTINGYKTVKISFETTLGDNDKRNFNAIIYKFLLKQDKKEYVVFFFLITESRDYYSDNLDFTKVISTLNLTSQKTAYNAQRVVQFEHMKFIISKPVDYDFFSNSVFKDMKLNEFTKTYCFADEIGIYDLELLVPKKIEGQPIIHFYSMNALKEQMVTQDDFAENKLFWKEMYDQSKYAKLLDSVISDSLLFCQYEFSDTEPNGYIHLKDEPKFLSTLVFINSKIAGDVIRKILVTNYLYLNNTVVFITLSQDYESFSDIEKIQHKSNFIVSEFLKNNDK